MALPSVNITKADGNTGVVRPSPDGNLAIIAPCASGTKNQAASFTRIANALTAYGHGPLVESASYVLPISGKPVVLIRPDTSTDGAYGTVAKVAGGTATPVAGSSDPLDDYSVVIEFKAGGALGTPGITYRYSLDGGNSFSKIIALGTALTITIPDSGVSFTLGTSTQTILAGQSLTCTTTAPQATVADLADAFEALRVSSLPWETVLIHGDADEDTVAAADLFLQQLEAAGKFRWAIVNVRPKGAAETEAEYQEALELIAAQAASTRVIVCADGGDLVTPLRNLKLARPTSLGAAARFMAIPISRDAAFVADGPISGYSILDSRGNPKFHNEALFPGLDDLRFVTLRTHEKRSGVFITNPNVMSPEGSDYVYAQHVRVANRACEAAFDAMQTCLSQSIRKNPEAESNGEVYILEQDAAAIEGFVQTVLNRELKGHVSAVRFILSRTDDVSSNAGAKLTGTIQVQALGYIKTFDITMSFVKAVTAQAA